MANDLVINLLGRTQQFESAMGRARSIAVGVAKGIIGAFATMRTLDLFSGMITSAESFDRAMRASTAIMGDLSEQTKTKMREAALESAKVTQFSATEQAKAYYFLASAGLSAEQQIKALPIAAKLAQAGQFDMAKAAELLGGALFGMGLQSRDAGLNQKALIRIGDVLVRMTSMSNATTEQFAEALASGGSAARIVGVSLEETGAILAAFAMQGTKGAEAGTALQIVLRDLQKANIESRKVWEQHGLSVYDAGGKLRKVADIIGDFEKAMASASPEQKKMLLATLDFQDRSVKYTQKLIGMSETMREWENTLLNAGGTMDKVAAQQMSAFIEMLNRVRVAGTKMAIGYLETVKPALVRLGALLEWLLGLVGGFSSTLVTWVVRIAAVAAAIWAMTKAYAAAIWVFRQFVVVQKAAAIAAAILQGVVGGPAGVAKVAVGIATALAVVAGIEYLFADVEKAASSAVGQSQKLPESLQETANKKTGIDQLSSSVGNLGDQLGHVKSPGDLFEEQGKHLAELFQTFDQMRSMRHLKSAETKLKADFGGLAGSPGIIGEGGRAGVSAMDDTAAAQEKLAAVRKRLSTPQALKLENMPTRAIELAVAEQQYAERVRANVQLVGKYRETLKDLNASFGDLGKAVAFADKALEEIKTPTEHFEEAKTKIELLTRAGLDQGKAVEMLAKAHENLDQALGGPAKHLDDLRSKIVQLEGGFTDAKMALAEFAATPGVSPELMASMEAAQSRVEALEEKAKAAKEFAEKVKDIREKIQTPEEKFAVEKADILKLIKPRGLSQEEAGRAITMLAPASSKAEANPEVRAGAMERGSKEAWSAILASMDLGRSSEMQKVASNTGTSAEILAEIKEYVRKQSEESDKTANI